jgi:hypothetical protein
VLDGAGGANGQTTSPIGRDTAAVIMSGVPRVFYSTIVGGHHVLRYGILSTTPSFTTLDGAGGAGGRTTDDVGSDVSATVYNGVIHIFYRDDTRGNLRHAWLTGSTWQFQTLDGASTVSGRVDADVGQRSAATVFQSRLEVFYVDASHADVRRASFNGTSWSLSTVDGNSTSGGRTIHDVGFNIQARAYGDQLHVFYYEGDPAYSDGLGWVREARSDGATWTFQRAFRVSSVGYGKTLAVGVAGATSVYVVYNTTNQDEVNLRYRYWNGNSWSGGNYLTTALFGGIDEDAVFANLGSQLVLVYCDSFTGDDAAFTFANGGSSDPVDAGLRGSPTSALVTGGSVVHVYWGAADTTGSGTEAVLAETTGP